jgi:hypothetical protein
VRRALLLGAAAALLVTGCGADPRDPGDSQALHVLALAAHERSVADRAAAAARTGEGLTLQELLGEARLGQEDIESGVPFGAPGRVPALEGAREVVRATSLMAAGSPLARGHLVAAARALRGAAGALQPRLTAVEGEALARLRAPAPALP